MTTAPATTTLSVRGEAQRTTMPDYAQVSAGVTGTRESAAAAIADVQVRLSEIVAELRGMGGTVLTADTTRAPLTWSAPSVRTQEEYAHNKRTGEHGPTGRQQASVTLLVVLRDLTLLPDVAAVLTSRDPVDVHQVSWWVDEDNAEWALVRADAIRAAVRKGQDYAAALGGSVTSVDHVADAGLLGGREASDIGQMAKSMAFGAAGGGDDLALDPPPQVLRATIEARLTAEVSALPER